MESGQKAQQRFRRNFYMRLNSFRSVDSDTLKAWFSWLGCIGLLAGVWKRKGFRYWDCNTDQCVWQEWLGNSIPERKQSHLLNIMMNSCMAPSVKKFKFFPLQVFISSLFLVGNLDHLNWMRHSRCKSSATHFCLYMQYFRGSEQGYGCQCLEFLMCAQIVMHAIARRSCTDTIRVSALNVDSGREKKSLAAAGTRTHVSTAFGFLAC